MSAIDILKNRLNEIREAGVYKPERIITSRQGVSINTGGKEVLNFCANNYLGLGGSEKMVELAREGLDKYGYGLNSVRFICGTQDIHKELEKTVAEFSGAEDAVLYSSCFDANGGLFETLLTRDSLVISDSLNHASIIDGVRLCKAERKIYPNGDLRCLEKHLSEAGDRHDIILIATDGVFSMDGSVAELDKIVPLAKKHGALLMVDDSHAAGVIGKRGRGSAEYRGVFGEIDIITGTFGKALGGASGGYTACRKEVAELLRQKSRPYLFSNSLAPSIVYAELQILKELTRDIGSVEKLQANTRLFRDGMKEAGFDIKEGSHPIVPVMLYDERKAMKLADDLLKEGIYVIGFCYPVVPKGEARIRVQISASHSREQIEHCVAAFSKLGG